jgi:hypothetical protein
MGAEVMAAGGIAEARCHWIIFVASSCAHDCCLAPDSTACSNPKMDAWLLLESNSVIDKRGLSEPAAIVLAPV